MEVGGSNKSMTDSSLSFLFEQIETKLSRPENAVLSFNFDRKYKSNH